jgi:rhodanese-related sulfurtransferase
MILQQRKWIQAVWQSGALLAVALLAGLLTNGLRSDGLRLFAAPPSAAETVSSLGENTLISLEEAEALFLAKMAVFLDARPEDLFLEGHIKGARNLPAFEFEVRFPDVMADIPPETTIITYCDGEDCALSHHLAGELIGKGYTNVRVLLNGWSTWRQTGLPIEVEVSN